MVRRLRVIICLSTFLTLLYAGRVSLAQDTAEEEDPVLGTLEIRIDSFLEGISAAESREDYDKAYRELFSRGSLAKQEKALDGLIDKTEKIETKYGPCTGFERIAAKRIGEDLVLLRYLYKCEEFPVVWYFTFYRTNSSNETPSGKGPWRVITVRFDTELELLAL